MPKHFAQQGFSLLEVLVAFVLLSFSLAVILQIFSGSLRNVSAADNYTQAMVLADAKLAALGSELPLTIGETGGESGNFRWLLTVRPYEYRDETAQQSLERTDWQLLDVTISVHWQQGARQPQFNLRTLRIGDVP